MLSNIRKFLVAGALVLAAVVSIPTSAAAQAPYFHRFQPFKLSHRPSVCFLLQ